jgi:uncharacterized protein with von Willebrand factor type A (vWA) domain
VNTALVTNLLHFGNILRRAGLDAGPGRMLTALQALEQVQLGRRADFYVALRAALVRGHDDLPVFDRAFAAFFEGSEGESRLQRFGARPAPAPSPRGQEWPGPPTAAAPARELTLVGFPDGEDGSGPKTEVAAAYSAAEVLREKDFEQMSAVELAATRRLMQLMQLAVARRRSRRLERLASGRRRLDLRRLMRLNLHQGGEMLRLAWRGPKMKRRPLVLLCDISGSMERYSRSLLHFVHAVEWALPDVEAFVFATRLTRITRHLRTHDVDAALAGVSGAVQDWASGTRMGEALRDFNRRWGRRVLGQGAVVVIMSDGWDRGDPQVLREEMARLQRSCHRLIWMNPLLGQADYQPLTLGMDTALPYVDDFVSAHNLASLEALADMLADERPRRLVRRQRPAFAS